MTIRDARESDIEGIVRLGGSLYRGSEALDYQLRKYFEDNRLQKFIVYEEENEVLGFACFEKGDGEGVYFLRWLAVSVTARGKGIGSSILKYIEDEIGRNDNLRILVAETLEGCPAEKFYEKNGFKKVNVIKDYYSKGIGKSIFIKRYG